MDRKIQYYEYVSLLSLIQHAHILRNLDGSVKGQECPQWGSGIWSSQVYLYNSGIKLRYKVTGAKALWHWPMGNENDQKNKRVNPETYLPRYGDSLGKE